jgi:hypothetical protein
VIQPHLPVRLPCYDFTPIANPTRETSRQDEDYAPGPWVYYNSSRLYRARYDSSNQVLEVEWEDGGIPYVFLGVEPDVWHRMNNVVSVGKFVNRVLNKYPYAPKIDQ